MSLMGRKYLQDYSTASNSSSSASASSVCSGTEDTHTDLKGDVTDHQGDVTDLTTVVVSDRKGKGRKLDRKHSRDIFFVTTQTIWIFLH